MAAHEIRVDLRKNAAAEGESGGCASSAATTSSPRSSPHRGLSTRRWGLSIDADGVNHSEDVTVATRDALLEMIDHLTTERGFDRRRACAICSVAVDLRAAALPDVPNMVVAALLPTDIFTD